MIRPLTPQDVTNEYVDWLNNPHRARYLSCELCGMLTLSSQRDYVRSVVESPNDAIFGLFFEDRLVGTSGIQQISTGGRTTLGMMIGPEAFLRRGLGTALVWGISVALLKSGMTEAVWAGVHEQNIGSMRIFNKCGFEAVEHRMVDGAAITMFRLLSEAAVDANGIGINGVIFTLP